MKEFYSIIVLDNICNLSRIIAVASSIVFVSFLLLYPAIIAGEFEWGDIKAKKILKSLMATMAVSFAFMVFTPNKAEMFLITGLGGAVDYIRENDTAKQIPDKCLMLIDKWIDEELSGEKKLKDK